jgi:hypothetical protein
MSIGGSVARRGLFAEYSAFMREEPHARAYLGGTLVDDLGIAISAWASALMMTNLSATQHQRASLMLPLLLCFLVGTLISGPLADWAARFSEAALARWRWKVVLVGRAIETVLLGVLVVELSLGPPTIPRVLPYMMVSAFMKTSLRATRIAFSVDLLQRSTTSQGEDGAELKDERGAPLEMKTHLVTFTSLVKFFATAAALGGLVVGGRVMAAVGGRTWVLFAVDVLSNVGFLFVLWRWCAPPEDERSRLLERTPLEVSYDIARHFRENIADGFRFLGAPARRPLLALLAGSWIVEVVSEAYDGKMITKHLLHGSDDAVRWAEIAWTVVVLVGAALLPLVLRRTSKMGKIFVFTMSLDAAVIVLAGLVAQAGEARAIAPFVAVLCLDHSLTLASTTLTDVAQNSVSSAAMRGRIAGTYAILVILGDIASEAMAAMAEDRWGIPGLVVRVGVVQGALVGAIALLGGRGLWHFGLRTGGVSFGDVHEIAATAAGPT